MPIVLGTNKELSPKQPAGGIGIYSWTGPLRGNNAGYRANLAAAGDSDARLLKRLQENANQLTSLSIDAAVSQMPRLQVKNPLPLPHFCLLHL